MLARTVVAGRVLALCLGVLASCLLPTGPPAAATISSLGDALPGQHAASWGVEAASPEPDSIGSAASALAVGVEPVDAAVHIYDYRSTFARPPPLAAHAYDTFSNSSDPADDLGRVQRAYLGLEVRGVAPRNAIDVPRGYSVSVPDL